MYDVIIIGGGPAGMSAAIYCSRANLKTCIIDKQMIGGNPLNYLEIENYLGLGKTDTFSFIEKCKEHLSLFNVDIFEFENIINVDLENKIIKTEDKELKAKYIIIATGSKPRMLNVPGEKEHIGNGVHYCAICDGPQYKNKIVTVIGGGNSACEEALGLSKICEKVNVIEFADSLSADKTTLDKIYSTENISVYTGYSVEEIKEKQNQELIEIEDGMLCIIAKPKENLIKQDGVVLYSTKPNLRIWTHGIFVYIGMSPNIPAGINVDTDQFGYINTTEFMEVQDGIYAIGDIRNKYYRQVVTAVSDGAIAAIHISKR